MNGYISIEVAGNPVGIKFAYPAMKWFMEAAFPKADIFFVGSDVGSMMTDYGMAKLIECGYRNNCLNKEVEPTLVFEDFINWVDDESQKEGMGRIAEVYKCYADSNISKKIEQQAGGQKKSQLLQTSS